MTILAAPNPGPDDGGHLPADVRRRILAVHNQMAKALRDIAPEHAYTLQDAKAWYAHLNAALLTSYDAHSDAVLFERAAGASGEHRSRWNLVLVPASMLLITAAEVVLGYPGMRYALGERGDVPTIFHDPVSLLASLGFGTASALLAATAAHQFARAERSVLAEPEPAVVDVDTALPPGVQDSSGAGVIPPSLQSTPAAPAEPLHGVAPQETQEDGRPAAARLQRIVRDGRRSAVRLVLAVASVALGVALWAINGVFRGEYIAAITAPPAAPTSIASVAQAPVTAPDATFETLLVALGVVFFLVMVVIATASTSPVALRSKELQRRSKRVHKNVQGALEKAERAIRAWEKAHGKALYATAEAGQMTGTLEAGTDEDR